MSQNKLDQWHKNWEQNLQDLMILINEKRLRLSKGGGDRFSGHWVKKASYDVDKTLQVRIGFCSQIIGDTLTLQRWLKKEETHLIDDDLLLAWHHLNSNKRRTKGRRKVILAQNMMKWWQKVMHVFNGNFNGTTRKWRRNDYFVAWKSSDLRIDWRSSVFVFLIRLL